MIVTIMAYPKGMYPLCWSSACKDAATFTLSFFAHSLYKKIPKKQCLRSNSYIYYCNSGLASLQSMELLQHESCVKLEPSPKNFGKCSISRELDYPSAMRITNTVFHTQTLWFCCICVGRMTCCVIKNRGFSQKYVSNCLFTSGIIVAWQETQKQQCTLGSSWNGNIHTSYLFIDILSLYTRITLSTTAIQRVCRLHTQQHCATI